MSTITSINVKSDYDVAAHFIIS